MATQVQFRRGTTTEHNSFTGAAAEVTVDTTLDTLRVHDGSTAGGVRIAKFSEIRKILAKFCRIFCRILQKCVDFEKC